jgi:MarR family transcriptional regulator, lower aerobic nicotinate degradation pathway regulator
MLLSPGKLKNLARPIGASSNSLALAQTKYTVHVYTDEKCNDIMYAHQVSDNPKATETLMKKTMPTRVELDTLPGHHIRRLHQIAVAIFLQETEAHGLTPVQYAAMQAVANTPGFDQRTLASTVGFDTSTIGGVIDRLEARGLIMRSASPNDRRVRLLTLTDAGRALLEAIVPSMLRAQARMLEPLPKKDRSEFMRMLRVLVAANNELSRAPSDAA